MNEKDVRLTYRFLKHEKETEIRLMSPYNARDVKSIFVYSEDEFVDICRKFQNRYNVYVGINERKLGGRTSADVISLNAIVVDIDAIHPKGLPATEAEIRTARIVAERLLNLMKQRGKNPYLAMSGNGWQVWMKVGVSLEGYDNKKVAAVLKDMHKATISEFSNEGAKIDNIGDLARVIKVIGTKAVKATTNETRKNRVSFWDVQPENVPQQREWGDRIKALSLSYESHDLTQINAPAIELSTIQRFRYMVKFDSIMRRLYEGDLRDFDFPSRSEAEFYLLSKMRQKGIPPEDAWLLMDDCKIGKWKTAKDAYKQLTMAKIYSEDLGI